MAKAVSPGTGTPAPLPSPFAHLPLTPLELLRMYVEVVGVEPQDCFSAQVCENRPRDLMSVTRKGPLTVRSTSGAAVECADGEHRKRLVGGSHVVIVYRDSAEYADGRARWAAYQEQVLGARLERMTAVRAPVSDLNLVDKLPRGVRALANTADKVADLVTGEWTDDPFSKIPPHRYCWPPLR